MCKDGVMVYGIGAELGCLCDMFTMCSTVMSIF
jgi:hypothetical protein